MSEEELQSAEPVIESNDEVIEPSANPNEGAELAPAEPEKVVFDDKQQEVLNGIVGKKTHQLRSTERELEEAQAKIREIESKLPQEVAPQIPNLPDKYDFDSDEEYHRAVAERDESIRQAVAFDSRKNAIQEQTRVNEQSALQEQQRKQTESENKLIERAGKNGIKQDDLLAAAQTVGNFRLNPDIADAIIGDKDGDAIIMHLAENPVEADRIARMSIFDAVVEINTNVRDKAQKFKLAPSSAPDPSTIIKGKGGIEDNDGFTIE